MESKPSTGIVEVMENLGRPYNAEHILAIENIQSGGEILALHFNSANLA